MSSLFRAPEQKVKAGLRPSHQVSSPIRLGAGPWIVIAALLLLVAATGFVPCLGWTLEDGIRASAADYIAMATGVLLSLIVGCGLMALVLYNSRCSYDETAALIRVEAKSKRIDRRRSE